jgi:hypothetical protein
MTAKRNAPPSILEFLFSNKKGKLKYILRDETMILTIRVSASKHQDVTGSDHRPHSRSRMS